MSKSQLKAILSQDELPTNYYNIQHDVPTPLPP